jgi:hypothetical protein
VVTIGVGLVAERLVEGVAGVALLRLVGVGLVAGGLPTGRLTASLQQILSIRTKARRQERLTQPSLAPWHAVAMRLHIRKLS